ncbi:Amino acid/polyamine transporter I [Metarhizium brunneum]
MTKGPPSRPLSPPGNPAPSSGASWAPASATCLVSLAEFLSAYPTAGGQYQRAAIVSFNSASRAVGYVTASTPPHTFNAITAASVVALGVTYAIPPAINIPRRRTMLPANRSFRLPGALGWISTWHVGVLWTVLTAVLYVFPPSIPVTANNMNYFILAFDVMLLIAGGTWVSDGRRHYQRLQLNIQGLMKGKLEVMEPAMGVDSSSKAQEAMLQGQVAAALL